MKTYAQASQDLFVRYLTGNRREGTFVDVGCQLPVDINNTCLLYHDLTWRGVSIDIEDFATEWQAAGRSPFVQADALRCDYVDVFNRHGLPPVIDYLNVDIEGAGFRFKALQRVMASGYQFAIVTVEHDVYRGYDASERQPQRVLMTSHGYELLCADVRATDGTPFEDWWVHPAHVPLTERVLRLRAADVRHCDIIDRVRDEIEGYA